MSISIPKRTLSFVLAVCMIFGLSAGMTPSLHASMSSEMELANMVYTEANAAAEYDREAIPGSSHFAATSGEFMNDSRLTAWSGNEQVVIGYVGSNKTPVVLNNGSVAGGWRSVGDAPIDVGVDATTATAFQIQFKTTGYENIRFSSSQKSTGSGPESFALAYSIGNPNGPFTTIADSKKAAPKEAKKDDYTDLRPTYVHFVLPPELNDEEEVYLRIYMVDSALSDRQNGNTSINDIVIIGDALAGAADDTELMGLTYQSNTATAAYDYAVVPNSSHFTATGGLYQDDFRLTAWSGNEQVLIGYAGSNRSPVVLNNGSITGGWRSVGPAAADEGITIATATAFQIQFKTAGYENISFSSSQKSTGSGPEFFALAYSIGNPEGPYTAIADSKRATPKVTNNNNYADLHPSFIDFVLPSELNNQDEVYLRVYMVDSAIASGDRQNGNTSINDIVITGDVLGSGGTPVTESMISAIASQTFKGAPIEPTVTVTDESTTLVKDTHYTLSYSNNTNVGTTAQVTVTAKPGSGYSGSASKSFAITSALPATYGTKLTHLGSYSVGATNEDGGVAEIVVYNKDNQKIYVVSGELQVLDIVPLAGIKAGQMNTYAYDKRVDVSTIGTAKGFSAGDITSVAVNTRLKAVAVSVQRGDYNADYDKNGYIVFLDYDGNYIAHYEAGVQPDMIGFSPDNNYVMTANEGERRNFGVGSVDPKGSVTIIDLRNASNHDDLKNLAADKVTTVYFDQYDDPAERAQLVTDLVLLKADAAPSEDLEPEYIAFSEDNLTAYVSLQEANAVATFDLATKSFTSIKGLGFKDHSLPGNEIDFRNDKIINIKNEPLYGVYMPDGLATINIGGVQYVLTPNEGDSRTDWAGYIDINEGSTIPGLGNVGSAEWLKNAEREILKDRLDDIFIMGGRSFAIWNASDMSLIYDSGSDFERITAEVFPTIFNAHHKANGMEARSPRKGPEPEDVKVLQIGSKIYAFIGLERIGGLMMYDITTPTAPVMVDYFNNRDPLKTMDDHVNDLGAEGISVIPAEISPTGWPMVLVANEVSGTVTVLQINEGYKAPSSDYVYVGTTPPPAKTTIPGSGGAGPTAIPVTVNDSTGEVSVVPDKQTIEALVADAIAQTEAAPVVTLDLSGLEEATAAILNRETAQALSESGIAVAVKLPAGSITLAPESLAALVAANGAGESSITVKAALVEQKDLKGMQAAQVKGYATVVSIDLFAGGQKIDMPITVSLPYTLKSNENPAAVRVWHMDDNGDLTDLIGTYDRNTGMITFTVNHQSYFVTGYEPATLWVNTFNDVAADAWYYDAVAYASYYGLFTRYGDGIFAPQDRMTRAMFATVLWNLEGNDTPSGSARFSDVVSGEWYYAPVQWAAENGIVSGVGNGKYDPDRAITRQEMALMLINYAHFKSYDLTQYRSLPDFIDDNQIDSWAETAVRELSEAGVLNGSNTREFMPQKDASRAEAAQMFKNFLRFVVKSSE